MKIYILYFYNPFWVKRILGREFPLSGELSRPENRDYEFSHSLSSGERTGISPNQILYLGLQGYSVGSTYMDNSLFM